MLKHILVTLDGSELAELALPYAQQIITAGAKITLLTVFDVPDLQVYTLYQVPMVVQENDYDRFVSNMETSGREYLNRVAESLAAQGYQVDALFEAGDPATVIVDTARKLNVDAVVMSTHGRSGISRWLFGSVTQRVLSDMPCPVLVVPGREPERAEETVSRQATSPA